MAGSSANSPLVSIITPVYNAQTSLAETLESLLRLGQNHAIEIIVVNDGSTDDSLAIAQRFKERADVPFHVLSKENGGEASALNCGWRQAVGAYVAILEADVQVSPDWLDLTLPTLELQAKAMAVGGMLETPKGDPWISRLAGYDVEAKLRSQGREVRHLTSANVLYRHGAFEIAGPFDERLINASLDAVFNARLLSAGYVLIFEPKAKVKHHYKSTFSEYLKRHFAYARYRVFAQHMALYPADVWLSMQVGLAGLGLLTPALAFVYFLAAPQTDRLLLIGFSLIPALLAMIVLVPIAILRLLTHRDPATLLYVPVAFVRNLIASIGTTIGLLERLIKR
jgi:glycosyltransferase involved in cell wall biosynthesis